METQEIDEQYDAYEAQLIQEWEEEQSQLNKVGRKIDAHNAEFKKKWPCHCTDCGGWGMNSWQESRPYGMGSAYESMSEPCECTYEGKCARCGKEEALGEECEGPCKFCGWNYDDGLQTM